MRYSIITINYNNRDGLLKTIESVVSQSYKDFEYIVIDGGSTDGSRKVIEEFSDRIDYWVSEPDKGIYNAMNKGIIAAHGDYLNFMNSGDCFYDKEVLSNTIPYLTADIVHGKLYYFDLKERSVYLKDSPNMFHFYDNTLNHQASFISRKLFANSLYDEKYKIVSDWKFFIEKLVIQNCSFASMPVKVGLFEEGGISESQRVLNAKERNEVLTELFPPRVIEAFERFKGKESPMLDLIPQFNKTYRLQNFILFTVKTILKVYNIFKRKS
ncbi:MAG: glycosyltransferase [Saccharofermentans sp.]|nr:glycosyltransferase [Saccharofermentans sp.]